MSKAAKRERQRLNRETRRQIEEEAEKRRKRFKTARNFGIVLLPIVVIFVILQITNSGDDDDTPAAGASGSFATLTTSKGDIVVRLDPDEAPNTVENFETLARDGFFDGLTFHRASRNVGVIQTGDGSTGQNKPVAETIQDELPSKGPYKLGDVAMANAGPDTASSQFFIVTGTPGTELPQSYSRFGKVVSGLDIAQQIEALAPENGDGPPTEPVSLESVKVTKKKPATVTTTTTTATTTPATSAPPSS